MPQRAPAPIAPIFAALLLGLTACSSVSPSVPRPTPTSTAAADKPIAALRDSLLTWADLQPLLAEAAGAAALEEAILDRVLEARLRDASITIPADARDVERESLALALQSDADLSPDQVQTQIDRLRRARGLGPTRFDALLLRNARLRALVRTATPADITPTPDQLAQEQQIANGDRYRVRVFFNASQVICSQVRDEVLSADGPTTPQLLSSRFADAAVRLSTDPSSRAGGLIDAVSAADPAVPEAIRQSLATLQPGDLSPVLVTGRGFGLVLMEARTPAPRQLTAEQVDQRVRSRLERLAMERLARECVTTSGLSVLDPSLAWSWENR